MAEIGMGHLSGVMETEGAPAGTGYPVHKIKTSDTDPLPVDLPLNPVDAHSSGADISSATPLTPPAGATKLLIQAITQNVRYTLDGTTPTASVGFQLKAGDPPVVIPVGEDTGVKVIQETATASLQYQWVQ